MVRPCIIASSHLPFKPRTDHILPSQDGGSAKLVTAKLGSPPPTSKNKPRRHSRPPHARRLPHPTAAPSPVLRPHPRGLAGSRRRCSRATVV